MSAIRHEHTLNPVTALAFYHLPRGLPLLLAAEGLYVKVFNAHNSELIACVHIFESQTIHGIVVKEEPIPDDDLKVVIWGGRSFVLLSSRQMEDIIARKITSVVQKESSLSDWILDAAISHPSECLFVTIHNAVLQVAFLPCSKVTHATGLILPSQAMLYSAHIIRTSDTSFLLATGSVFGEIEVIEWREGGQSTLCTLNGHEGSIFGVQISPSFTAPNGCSMRLLASCSDDRTIRLWNLGTAAIAGDRGDSELEKIKLPRATGFGENTQDLVNNESEKRLIATAMGHASRIWHVRFFITCGKGLSSPSHIDVMSFGEDATCQQWSLDFRSCPASSYEMGSIKHTHLGLQEAVLTHRKTFAYHDGKHLWAIAVHLDDDFHAQVATGGADGKVSLYVIASSMASSGLHQDAQSGTPFMDIKDCELGGSASSALQQCWALENLSVNVPRIENNKTVHDNPSPLTPEVNSPALLTVAVRSSGIPSLAQKLPAKKQSKFTAETINRIGFVSKNQFITTTSSGRVLLGSLRDEWKELRLPELKNQDLKTYSLITGIPEHKVAFLAGSTGSIYVYAGGENVVEVASVPGKVVALLHVSGCNTACLNLIVMPLAGKEASLILFDSTDSTPRVIEKKTVCLPSKFVLTAVGKIGGLLILGSRSGHLAVYDFGRPHRVIHTLHIRERSADDAITTIITVPTVIEDGLIYFLATSRNGSYSIFSLGWLTPTVSNPIPIPNISLLHHALPPFSTIDAAWFDESHFYLSGFRGKSFIVWNETKRDEITTINCGGAHKSYAYKAYPFASGVGEFAYTKGSRLYYHSQTKPSHTAIKEGGHGREIKACALSPEGDLFATGAEDTTIRIWQCHQDEKAVRGLENGFECLVVIQKHTAGIQHLQWGDIVAGEEVSLLFSAGGTEEFYVWRVSRIPVFNLGIVLEDTLKDHSPDRDLRIMSFEVTRLPSALRRTGESIGGLYQIALAYSDSTIKVFQYAAAHGFRKVAVARYTAACITQICMLRTEPPWYMTTSTDGHVAFWEIPSSPRENYPSVLAENNISMEMVFREKVHQSNIASISVFYQSSGVYIIATGGDDNALAFTRVSEGKITSKVIIPDAHAAAVTGVGWIERPGGTSKQLWSIGGDQKLKCWTITIEKEAGVSDIKVDDVNTSVADAAGLVPIRSTLMDNKVLVYGTGIEIYRRADI